MPNVAENIGFHKNMCYYQSAYLKGCKMSIGECPLLMLLQDVNLYEDKQSKDVYKNVFSELITLWLKGLDDGIHSIRNA